MFTEVKYSVVERGIGSEYILWIGKIFRQSRFVASIRKRLSAKPVGIIAYIMKET